MLRNYCTEYVEALYIYQWNVHKNKTKIQMGALLDDD